MALSRVAFAATAGAVSTAQTTASFTWTAGDLFIAMQGSEGGGAGAGSPQTPTFGGGTFTAIAGGPYGDDVNHNFAQMYQCTVAGSSSGVVTDPNATSGFSHILLVWQFRGHNGIGAKAGLPDATFVISNANTGSNSWVCMSWYDFNPDASGRTGSPTVTNEVVDLANPNYSIWGGDWSGQSGTKSYGTTNAGSTGPFTKIVVEVLEAGGGPAFMPEPYGWWDGGEPRRQALFRGATR